MRPSKLLVATLITASVSLVAGCSKVGSGPAVRNDITARMQSASGPISSCYSEALRRNRKLAGMMMLSFVAEPGTGKFTRIDVARDEIGDTPLRQCVLAEVGRLALETPQKTNVDVRYPIQFTPSN